jgi:hypothetical protein
MSNWQWAIGNGPVPFDPSTWLRTLRSNRKTVRPSKKYRSVFFSGTLLACSGAWSVASLALFVVFWSLLACSGALLAVFLALPAAFG